MITLDEVSKIYPSKAGDVVALDAVSLQVQPGEIFGVIGKSGAGKSTLIRCVNLLEKPSSGDVIIDGQNLIQLSSKELRQARHGIGMVFQHFNLLATRTVFDNIALPLELIHADKSIIQVRVKKLLELVELTDKAAAYPSQLSGGQKQRVAIARALATEPKVLLCDEMTSALDPETTISILNLIRDINEKLNLTMLLITHEMDVIKRIADKVAVIDQGEIVEQGDVVDIFKRPQSAVAKRFTQDALHSELPSELSSVLQQHHTSDTPELLLRLRFIGEATNDPIINEVIKHCNVTVSILQANIDFLRHEVMGTMLVSMSGDKAQLQKVNDFLTSKGVVFEELGYVITDRPATA